jgi:hypothetical protein
MPCGIYRHIISGATAGVVEAAVFGLPIYRIDRHIDGGLGRGAARAVVHRQCCDLSQKHSTADYSISGD